MPENQSDKPIDGIIRAIQITDTHLYGDPGARLLKLNTQESFEAVLDLLAEREQMVDLFLATGDIAQDATPQAYERFAKTMGRFDAPFYWIPGNHDRRNVMRHIPGAESAWSRLIRQGNWQMVMLDSSVAGAVHGYLEDSELEWLSEALSAAADDANGVEHTLVCLHHNPVPGSANWMDGIGLHNSEALFEVLHANPGVRAVMYGHIHQELDFEREGIRYFCTPSTCIQFKPGVSDFALDTVNPAYRWLELHPDGSIVSDIVRVEGQDFVVDHDAEGY